MSGSPRWLPVAVALMLAGCTAAPAATPSAAPSPATPSGSPPAAHVPVAEPVGIAVAGGSVWVASAGDGTVVRLGHPSVQVEVGSTPLRLLADGGLVWVSVFGDGKFVAIDPATNRVVRQVPLAGQPEGLAAGFQDLWVVRQKSQSLTRISPGGKVLHDYPLGAEPRLVAVGQSYVFASNFRDGTISRLDPRTGSVSTARVCDGAQGMAAAGTVLWVSCTPANQVVAVGQQDLKVLGRLDLPGEPDAVHSVGDAVWVALARGPALVRLGGTPSAPAVAQTVTLDSRPGLADRANVDFAVQDGEFWVTAPQASVVYHVKPD
jgi:DNA-binding beta-propeller fold protein YncE